MPASKARKSPRPKAPRARVSRESPRKPMCRSITPARSGASALGDGGFVRERLGRDDVRLQPKAVISIRSATRGVLIALSHSDRRRQWQIIAILSTSRAFERTSKRRKGYPSETNVKRGLRFVHGDKELVEKLGRNDPCPCGSGMRFQTVLSYVRLLSTASNVTIIGAIEYVGAGSNQLRHPLCAPFAVVGLPWFKHGLA